jgi:GMP synthase-like glutamine amidotransferase
VASGSLDAVVVDCGSKKVGSIVDALEAAGARGRIVALDDAPSCDWSAPDLVVVSGGPRLFTEEEGLAERFVFLDRVKGALLGICLGHQALGLRYGARVFRGPERREVEAVEVTTPHPLFDGLEAPLSFVTDHCEGITLPEGFVLLGSSSHYEVEVMAHATLPRFGVQFHPEVSDARGARLLANFVRVARGDP